MDETYFITVIINHVKYELLGKKKKKIGLRTEELGFHLGEVNGSRLHRNPALPCPHQGQRLTGSSQLPSAAGSEKELAGFPPIPAAIGF